MKRPYFHRFLVACPCVLIVLYAIFFFRTSHESHLPVPEPSPCPGRPWRYNDTVDLRIIVLTYNRPRSLRKCLNHLQEVDLDGRRAALEIWIDRSVSGSFDQETYSVALNFSWRRGTTRVHIWPRHVGVYGQWIDTWRPAEDSSEVALFLEDDIDVSPYFYRWLRAAHAQYGQRHDVGSVGLSDQNVLISSGRHAGSKLTAPSGQPVYLYRIVVSWGMSPIVRHWRQFQEWFHIVRGDQGDIDGRGPCPSGVSSKVRSKYRPYTPGADLQTGWYKSFEKQGRSDSMWTMWFIHFCHLHGLFAVHPNLSHIDLGLGSTDAGGKATGRSLARNRQAPGLHYGGKELSDTERHLLKKWSEEFIQFPSDLVKFDYNGSKIMASSEGQKV